MRNTQIKQKVRIQPTKEPFSQMKTFTLSWSSNKSQHKLAEVEMGEKKDKTS